MNRSTMALATAFAGLIMANTGLAESGSQPRGQVQPTAFDYSSYYANYYAQDGAAASPSDQAPAESEEKKSEASGTCNSCTSCDSCSAPCSSCDACCCDDGCGCCLGSLFNPCCPELGDPWALFDCEGLKCRNITIAGWLGQSFTWNTTNPADRFNGPVTMTDRSNEYQLNQLYLYIEKATDTGGCGWDYGYRVDGLYGTDNRFTTTADLETRGYFTSPKWSTYRFYGPALPQFYLTVARNDVTVKMGHFYSPVGYEVVPMTGNFFPTLPYTFQYGEPFTHFGFLATWQATEKLALGAGLTRGWDNLGGENPHLGMLGTESYTFDDGSSLAFVQVIGQEPTLAAGFQNRFLQTNVYSRPLKRVSDKLNYVAQSDFGCQTDGLASGTGNAWWYGLNQYLFYQASDCLTYGIRAEWFRDDGGTRVGGFLGTTPDGSLRGLATDRFGYNGSFYEVTLGANYKWTANTTIRPAVRFDWFSGTSPSPTLRPFDGGNGNSQTLIQADVITVY